MPADRQSRTAAEAAEEALFADVDTFADWLYGECSNRTETGLPLVTDREAGLTDWHLIATPRLFAFMLDPRQGAATVHAARQALLERYKAAKANYLRRLYDDALIGLMADEREAA